MQTENTIAAISTPIGTGGIGIVRLSGMDAVKIASLVFRPNGRQKLTAMSGYHGCLGRIYDDGAELDEAIAFVYRAPKSYTGEDVVELSCHGGIWITQRVLRLCLDNDAKPAQPGEFTKRAFLNGKLDLIQAEAVMGLIHAHGDAALKAGMNLRDGTLSKEIEQLIDLLVKESAHLAAWADYPEEDLAPVDRCELSASLSRAEVWIQNLISTYDRGSILRHGVETAIIGKPNTGKSTLMNLLSRRDKSIVTDIPGTTRDIVEDIVQVGDITLKLFDTAGIRQTTDAVESIGVERARGAIERARLVLALFDNSKALDQSDMDVLSLLEGKTVIAVINKDDLPAALDQRIIASKIDRVVSISALTGKGRTELENEIMEAVGMTGLDLSDALVSTERQRDALVTAHSFLMNAIRALDGNFTLDAVNIDIDDVLSELFALTGARVTDKVVEELFSTFCVGK